VVQATYKTDEKVAGSYLSPEFIAAHEACWVPTDGKHVYVGCGDDREPTAASADDLAQAAKARGTVMNPLQGYASIYGGVAGEAKNVLVVGAAQYGKQFILDMGGFEGIMDLLIEKSRDPQTVHSAVGNEHDQRHFCMQGDEPVGCAYCGGTGATSGLLVSPDDTLIREVGRQDQKYVFGSDHGFDDLLRGHELVLEYATHGQGAAFALNRSEYKTYLQRYSDHLGLMMLSGNHTSAKTSGVISNFSFDEVGSTHIAHEKGLDFYRLDIAIVTRIVLDALHNSLSEHGYSLSPELLMRAFQLDATPVRAVLVVHDRDPELHDKLDPRPLPIGYRGNALEAIAALQ
jgi:hypothetical protein